MAEPSVSSSSASRYFPWRIIAAILIAIICYTLGEYRACVRHAPETDARLVYTDTTHVTIIDTICVYQPILRDSVVVRYITERFPVSKTPSESENNAHIIADSVAVDIPISQSVYAEEGAYTAYVSGYRATLDSILIYPKTEIVTIRNDFSPKPKRWGIGVSAGYGLTPRGLQPVISVGITYNLWQF